MKSVIQIFASLLIAAFLVTSAGQSFADKKTKSYDFNSAESRYQWYKDFRNYLGKGNGINCPPGTTLHVSKAGTVSIQNFPAKLEVPIPVQQAKQDCEASVKGKIFPLPANATVESVRFPIRDGNSKPLTQQALDKDIFNL